jgi:DNA-binding winged helix-turn-helix (wHTH) protein
MPVRFGEFIFEPGARELRRGGRAVHLSPKAIELLGLLLQRHPDAVSKNAILERLWPATFVSDASISVVVSELREALADGARTPRFIRTVHGFGYAFSGEVDAGKPTPGRLPALRSRHRLRWLGQEAALDEGENVLGRVEDAAAWIESDSVSRRHARLTISGDRAVVEDLGSKNGTFLNGRRIEKPQVLSDGDEIRLGQVTLTFYRLSAANSTRTDAGR